MNEMLGLDLLKLATRTIWPYYKGNLSDEEKEKVLREGISLYQNLADRYPRCFDFPLKIATLYIYLRDYETASHYSRKAVSISDSFGRLEPSIGPIALAEQANELESNGFDAKADRVYLQLEQILAGL